MAVHQGGQPVCARCARRRNVSWALGGRVKPGHGDPGFIAPCAYRSCPPAAALL